MFTSSSTTFTLEDSRKPCLMMPSPFVPGQPQQGTPGTNGLGIIKQGFLESSNVNVVEELVNMIQTQRAYEMNSKAISTTDQMLAKLSQL